MVEHQLVQKKYLFLKIILNINWNLQGNKILSRVLKLSS